MVNKEYSQVLTKDNEGFFRFIESTMDNCGITTEQLPHMRRSRTLTRQPLPRGGMGQSACGRISG